MGESLERILITGADGFIGRHLQKYLDSIGVEYDGLDKSGRVTWWWDITQPLPTSISGYSRVIHLAGVLGTHELFDQVHQAIDVNIKGTVNVLELCRREGIPFTGITMAHVWTNPYETTKLAAERLAEAWGREYDFPVNYVTVYNAFGEYQAIGPGHPQKIIPTFARHAWKNQPMPIWGDGTQVVDLIYAGSVAETLYRSYPPDKLQRFKEAGSGYPSKVIDVAKAVWAIAREGTGPKIQYLPMRKGEHEPTRDPVAEFPSAIIKRWDLDWDNLIKTVNWYKDRPRFP
jgi:UDP-glucose 4-epimerase